MKKKPKKPTKKSSLTRGQYILITVVLFIVTIPAAILGYQVYENAQDTRQFNMLKSDMARLRDEFNHLNPGWKSDEGCTGAGLLDDFKTCSVGLSNSALPTDDLEKISKHYEDVINRSDYLRVYQQNSFSHDSKVYVETRLKHTKVTQADCNLLVEKTTNTYEVSAFVGCIKSARKFHFDRTDR